MPAKCFEWDTVNTVSCISTTAVIIQREKEWQKGPAPRLSGLEFRPHPLETVRPWESSYSILSSMHEVNADAHPSGMSQRVSGSGKGLRPGSQGALLDVSKRIAVIQHLGGLANVLHCLQPTPPWDKAQPHLTAAR